MCDQTQIVPDELFACSGIPGAQGAEGGSLLPGCERQEDVRRLRQLLDTLPARERQILLLRYGLAGQPPLTQLETAGLLGISRSYVSRLETHALELLRQAWGKHS